VVDRARSLTRRPPVTTDAWSGAAADRLRELVSVAGDVAVVWARATPPESFEAAIRVHRDTSFPLIANYNDPMPRASSAPATSSTDRGLHDLQARQNDYLAAHADAFTFPSAALAEMMVRRADLAAERCFVIPHLTGARPAAERPFAAEAVPRLLYAGTPYSWVLEHGVGDALAAAQRAGRITPVLALRGGVPGASERFRAALPHAELHHDLDAAALDTLVDSCDALLLVDDQTPLLRTKVAEGVQRLRPLLAVAPEGSTTTEVVRAAGGLAATRRDEAAVGEALETLLQRLDDPGALQTMRREQEALAARWSPAGVLARIEAVVEYAAARHTALAAGDSPPPVPDLPPWL
jgi:hypothetical protein